MITKNQIDDLASYFQIDNFTVMREDLQILFLSYLYKEKEADRIYFKGGTAVRLLFGSTRFSEDLDFSTLLAKAEIKELIIKLERAIRLELQEASISLLYLGKNGCRFRLKYKPEEFKYPLVIRLDFNIVKKVEEVSVSPLVSKFPVIFFPLINHLSENEILAEKLCALFTRAKGRDFFDVWFLLQRKIGIDEKLLRKKLKERGAIFNREKILKRIELYSEGRLERDLKQFLPRSQRKIISLLKRELVKSLSTPARSGSVGEVSPNPSDII